LHGHGRRALVTFEIGSHIRRRLTLADPANYCAPGFAATPGFIQVFGALPGESSSVRDCHRLALAASVIAVRQALDYTSTFRAIMVCAIGLSLSLESLWSWSRSGLTLSGIS
jgi:hypothetical protein